jgi:hypothetical protein
MHLITGPSGELHPKLVHTSNFVFFCNVSRLWPNYFMIISFERLLVLDWIGDLRVCNLQALGQ